jgi:DNA-binding NtrC family response regulator
LTYTRGNKRAAAAILGVYRPTLYNKLRKYRLDDFAPRRPSRAGGREQGPAIG